MDLNSASVLFVLGDTGSGEATAGSDFDLLIEVTGPPAPWFPGGLVAELEGLLGRRADVVEAEGLRAAVRERVLREAVPP